jgi:NADPH:quinone reductase-like Zn-dependent oxidoreductase
MKAIVLTRYGTPEVLELREVAQPEPKAHEVRVKVHATAINDWDWSYVRGRPYVYRLLYGLRRPRCRVLGAEAAGTIAAVGRDVTAFQPGDRVYGDLSAAGLGGFAEFVCVPANALVRMPPGMTFPVAASLPHAAILALQGLVDVGQIRRGERVLINGAGGGVGTLGVQIAKTFDAEVTGVDSAPKLARLRALGLDQVIDYQQDDFTRHGPRYDLILDTRTTRAPFDYLRALTPHGRYVTVGGIVGRLLQTFCLGPLVACVSTRRLRIVALKPNQGLAYVNELFLAGRLRGVIDGLYPLADVPQALQRFGDARHFGKIVITVGS